jgi:hypothetical protein
MTYHHELMMMVGSSSTKCHGPMNLPQRPQAYSIPGSLASDEDHLEKYSFWETYPSWSQIAIAWLSRMADLPVVFR